MGKDLKGRELGVGISQRADELYVGRYSNKYGRRIQKVFPKLQECRKWLAEAIYKDKHSNLKVPQDLTVDAWFKHWIDYKTRTVRPNSVRIYKDRYYKNIKDVIGDMMLVNVMPIHCQKIMDKMADSGYRSSTIYQARIALYNMLDYAYQNEIIIKNPCNKMVRHDIGKPSDKKEALTIERQRAFCNVIKGNAYEYQYRFLLQTGLRTGEMIGLKWSDVDFEKRTLTVSRSMEYRYKVGEWRIGEPKSKAGYRTIKLTDEAIEILKLQKIKNNTIKVIPLEWSEFIFLCRKGTPVKNSTYDNMLAKVTPYLCDHSAFDSYMLLCESDDETILYTGDFRSNGRKSYDALLNALPDNVDILLCEGTTLSRENHIAVTERQLEERAVELFEQVNGPIFILQSSMNIDRIVTMYRAAKRSNRIFLEDVYMANIATGAGGNIPNPSFDDVYAFLTSPSRFSLLRKYKNRVGKSFISKSPFVMCVRNSMLRYMKSLSNKMSFRDGLLVYSFWSGYRETDSMKKFLSECEDMGLKVVTLHTSGHADEETIKRLVEKVSPKILVPIHTENGQRFKELFPDIVVKD